MTEATRAVEAVWRIESARLIAGLARMVGDIGFAEDLAQDALVAAMETWPKSGVPDNPGAWLMVAVTAWPKGGVRYDAWLWHAGRRRALALWWEESQRVTDLFRDCAASWFWVGPPPDSAKLPDSEPGAVPAARAEEGGTRE